MSFNMYICIFMAHRAVMMLQVDAVGLPTGSLPHCRVTYLRAKMTNPTRRQKIESMCMNIIYLKFSM
jgi:hypothetical protein